MDDFPEQFPKNFIFFADCVTSMRDAEKKYEKEPTAANRHIMRKLQNKTDGWLKWIYLQHEKELNNKFPPFIHLTSPSGKQIVMPGMLMENLKTNHTPEEIEHFIQSL